MKKDDVIKNLKNLFCKKNLIFMGIFVVIGLIMHFELIIREVYNPDSMASRIC